MDAGGDDLGAILETARDDHLVGDVGGNDYRLQAERLRARLAEALAPPKERRPTKPTRAARERRMKQKRAISQRKQARRPPSPED